MKKTLIILAFLQSVLLCYSDKIEDSIEIRLDIEPVYKLELKTFQVPIADYQEDSYIEPSKTNLLEKTAIADIIDFGQLRARKAIGKSQPTLVSEVEVMLQVTCTTNQNNQYELSQSLDGPITGSNKGETFPAQAIEFKTEIAPEIGQKQGQILLSNGNLQEGETQILYRSDPSGQSYLGNTLNVYYRVSDSGETKVFVSQKADIYQSAITITMTEI